MNSVEIDYILKNDAIGKQMFRGVFALDTLPLCNTGGYVCNLAPQSHPGTHWVALFCIGNQVDYFDSYGRSPPREICNVFRGKHVTHNTICLQSPFSAVCGQYCIYFLLSRMRGERMRDIIGWFDVGDLDHNDQMVYDFIRDNYAVDVSLIDTSALLVQLSGPQTCMDTTAGT